MQDIQLYQQLLGLTGPWEVGRVTLQRKAQGIEVEVRCLETVWGCPTCGQQRQGHGQEERRVQCLEPGTQQVAVP